MITVLRLDCGDAALVVNQTLVGTADPDYENPASLEGLAERLAGALTAPLAILALPTPPEADWNWDAVLADLVQAGRV